MNSTNYQAHLRYSDRAQHYADYRPSYPAEVISLIAKHGNLSERSQVAELGAGTGIFTRLLLNAGWIVHAVEPNSDMRAVCLRDLGDNPLLRCVATPAEATDLPSSTCSAVVAAQSFHWFDQARAAIEVQRVLAPGGILAIVWNELDRRCDDLHIGIHALNAQCPDHRAHSLSKFDMFESEVVSLFAGWKAARFELPNHQRLNLEALQGRISSSSHWPPPGSTLALEFDREIARLHSQLQEDGFVSLRYETRLLIFDWPVGSMA